MTFLGETIELYLQSGKFLENFMSTLNKKRKLKIDVSCYFHSSPKGVFRPCQASKMGIFLRKQLTTLS